MCLVPSCSAVPFFSAFSSTRRYALPFTVDTLACSHFTESSSGSIRNSRRRCVKGWRWLERNSVCVCVYMYVYAICLPFSSPLENSAGDRVAAPGSWCQIIWPSTRNRRERAREISQQPVHPPPLLTTCKTLSTNSRRKDLTDLPKMQKVALSQPERPLVLHKGGEAQPLRAISA